MASVEEGKMDNTSTAGEVAASEAAPNQSLETPLSIPDYSQLSAETVSLLKKLDMDPYDEDQAELRFLHSKPTCFIVLGKPGAGKTSICQKISQEWNCEHVNAQQVIQQALDLQTETGIKCQEMLLRGEAIPDDVISKMIEEKINSQEVAHHGYVLDGYPSLVEDHMTVKDQLELVKNWKLKPDFIINMKIPDKDLETRRISQKVDPLTGELYTKDAYDPDKPKPAESGEGGEEEEEEEEPEMEEEEEAELGLSPEVLERLVRRPEDLPTHVEENITRYKKNMLRILEDYMADHDQQYLIELDANKPVPVLFKELMMRLDCFVLRPAAVPMRLLDGEDEEIPEEVDTDDLLRQLSGKKTVSSKYRWRRSRWLRQCPVALAEGTIAQGKPEFAVSFLDKIYCMSSEEAMAKFMKNPRPYLLPPQPRPPCKLIVTGPPLSGKTTLCHLLAQKYGAKVINMSEFIKPKMEEAKKKLLEQIKEEATENAIVAVRNKLKEQWEQEQQQKEAAMLLEQESVKEEGEEDEDDADKEKGEEAEDAKSEKDEKEMVEDKHALETSAVDKSDEDTTVGASESKDDDGKMDTNVDNDEANSNNDDLTGMSEKIHARNDPNDPPSFDVDSDHPEVKVIVEAAVKAASDQEITLQPEVWIEVMEEAIKQTEQEMRRVNPDGPLAGGWIFDNFPRTRDQWTAMLEKGISPDEVINLKDESENGDLLIKRWYYVNRTEIALKIEQRKAEEEAEKRKKEEEERQKLEEEKAAAEEAADIAKAEEHQRRIEAGEISEEEAEKEAEEGEGGTEVEDKKAESPSRLSQAAPEIQVEAEEERDSARTDETEADGDETSKHSSLVPEPSVEQDKPGDNVELPPTPPPATPEQEKMPPDGVELDAQREHRKQWDVEWTSSLAVITGTSSLEPIVVDIQNHPEEGIATPKCEEDILKEVIHALEKNMSYQGWEMQGQDIDEEEEDADADGEEEEEEEPEEEVDPNRALKKQLGDLNYFCPVALKEKDVLWPGNPEIAAKYREKTYYFSSNESREKFLEEPTAYLPKGKPFKAPPIRLLILGPRGSGKTLHSRHLAQKLGLFHIQYRERLQELIIAKTKKKVGPEFEEDDDEPEYLETEDDEDGEGAIQNPDGTQFKDQEPNPEKTESKETILEEKSGNEEEEEERLDLTEDEEAIVNYLKDDEALPSEVLDKIVPDWWNKEPFKSTGFILEGFPRTTDEAEYLAEKGLFPDAALILAVEDTDVIARLLPPKLEKWRNKRDKKMAKKKKLKEKKEKKRAAAIAKRREELLKEQEDKKAQRKAERQAEKEEAGGSDGSDEEEEEEEDAEEEEDIEAILAEEFEEEEEEEEEEELEEDATDRMKNALEEVYDNDTNRLSDVQNKLEDALIQRIELDAGRKAHIVRYAITKKLMNIIQHRDSIFERVYPIKEKLALRMLKTGYKQPSRFGHWCPVQLMEGEVIQPMQGPGYQTYPALYRSFIYFLSSPSAREQFMQSPVTYLEQESPKPVVPIRMAIIGPPKCGKTTLAKRFAEEYGMMRLSIGEAVRSLLELQPHSELAISIESHLCKGLTVPDELAVQALEVALMNMRCQTRGFILDGYPMTKKQLNLMTKRSIIPIRVIELQVSAMEIATRATKDRYAPERIQDDKSTKLSTSLVYPLHDSAQITVIKLGAFQREVQAVREWYQNEHDNYVAVDGERSKWWVWSQVVDTAKKSVKQIQTYLQRIADGKAASVADMCITPSEFEVRLGDFNQYCPVRLSKGELANCSTTRSLKYAAEFRGHYYKMAGQEELNEFLNDPEKYVPPMAPNKLPPPELRPIRRTGAYMKEHFPLQIELQGYCPVSFKDGKQRYEAIVPGDPDLIVEYRNKYYSLESEAKLEKFMRLPEQYWDLKLPHKLPPKKELMPVSGLPMLGYMEQSISAAVVKALTAVGNFKPKFPYLSPTKSALIYVAYHLKAYNPRSTDYLRKKYKRKLMEFENTCELINYLGDNMTKKYKQPKDRPIDFDSKMEQFVKLQGVEPSSSWLL